MGGYNKGGRHGGHGGGRGGYNKGGRSGGYGGGQRSGGYGRDDQRPQLFRATCADCSRTCEVPFRPTGSKPVKCRECFRQDGGQRSSNRNSGGRSNRSDAPQNKNIERELRKLNEKMDAIIDALNDISADESEPEPLSDSEQEVKELLDDSQETKPNDPTDDFILE